MSSYQSVSLIIAPPSFWIWKYRAEGPRVRLQAEGPFHALARNWLKFFTLMHVIDLVNRKFIPFGEGRILNIDESMTYRYDQDEKTWTYYRLLTLLLFQETWKFYCCFLTENNERANYCPPLRFDEKWPKGGAIISDTDWYVKMTEKEKNVKFSKKEFFNFFNYVECFKTK